MYLYTLTFGIFLNSFVRFPSPILVGLPLIAIFWQSGSFLYTREALLFLIANFLYYGVAQADLQSVSVNCITIFVCILFFNFFVGLDFGRFKLAVIIFFSLLILSAIVMLLNHVYPSQIVQLRSKLIGAEIVQSPSGITSTIFNFGYQLAPLVSFLFIASIMFIDSWIVRIIVLIACLISIYFGMQRSVLLTFAFSAAIFLLFYYKYKSVIVIGLTVVISVVFSTFFISTSSGEYDNIFAKNDRNAEEDRGNLMTENLNIYADYPLGLMFYGKTWRDVTKYNNVYAGGITSHNAYLMFITYLGPFIGITLLLLIYYKIGKIFRIALLNIFNREYASLVCLCFSFFSVTLNAMFHNAWLIGANSASLFLYFAIVHRYNMQMATEEVKEEIEIKLASSLPVSLNA